MVMKMKDPIPQSAKDAGSSVGRVGTAGIPLAQRDQARGLTPGSGTDGSAGSVAAQGTIGRKDRISDAAAKKLG
jgi:hypothetical protein